MSLLDDLQAFTGLGRLEVLSIVRAAPGRYKQFLIPKRNGGARVIAQPAREVKALQRYLIEAALEKLPVHDAAAAYRTGRNIRRNAAIHVRSSVILKLDFSDFFPSIRVSDWLRYCRALEPTVRSRAGLASDEDIAIATRLLFWGRGSPEPKCLSIGAPSSPILSNIMMWGFDERISAEAKAQGVSYTRYADDITLSASGSHAVLAVETAIERDIRRHRSPLLSLNAEKRGLYTSGQKRMVTGLVITPEEKVSLGRERKRMIHSLVHRFGLGALDPQTTARVQGLVAFAKDAEPTFHRSLVRKYGAALLTRLSAFRLPKKTIAPRPRRGA